MSETNIVDCGERRARAASERKDGEPSAVTAAHYLPRRDAIELEFASRATMTIPRGAITELAGAPTAALKPSSVSVVGDVLVCPALGVAIEVPALMEVVLGPRLVAAAFGRRGGRRTSKAKAAAARANGARGGRPRNRSAR